MLMTAGGPGRGQCEDRMERILPGSNQGRSPGSPHGGPWRRALDLGRWPAQGRGGGDSLGMAEGAKSVWEGNGGMWRLWWWGQTLVTVAWLSEDGLSPPSPLQRGPWCSAQETSHWPAPCIPPSEFRVWGGGSP